MNPSLGLSFFHTHSCDQEVLKPRLRPGPHSPGLGQHSGSCARVEEEPASQARSPGDSYGWRLAAHCLCQCHPLPQLRG